MHPHQPTPHPLRPTRPTDFLALALMQDERAAHSTAARAMPSQPRRFSWERGQ